jgi:hypothetical protein
MAKERPAGANAPRRDYQWVILVARDQSDLYAHLHDALRGDPKAVERRGFRIATSEGERVATHIEGLAEKVEIGLEERSTRQEHVLSNEERDSKAKRGWTHAPRWDYEPSGILQLRIKEVWGDRIRKSRSDGRKHKLEEVLNDVITGIIVVADAKKRHRLDLERQQREWAEAERRRVSSSNSAARKSNG